MKLTRHSLLEIWEGIQVELHGAYSEQRVRDLEKYIRNTSWMRAVAVLIATPLPCLIVTLQIDALPLTNPSEGIQANKWFFVREYYAYIVMTSLVILQFRTGLRLLPYPNSCVIRDTLLIAALSVGVLYGFATTIGFPVPFTTLTVVPAWATLIVIGMTLQWLKPARETPGAGKMLLGMFKLWMCDMALVFTYPPYFYIYTTLSNKAQMVFTVLLPMIKMFMRNIFARAVGHLGDEIPQLVVFNADVFGSLFISYCMQSTPSFWTTLEIMVADAVTMGLALNDIETERVKLIELSRRIDDKLIGNSSHGPNNFTGLQNHELTALERACNLLEQVQSIKSSSLSSNLDLKQESMLRKAMKTTGFDGERSQKTTICFPLGKYIFGRDRVHPIGKEAERKDNGAGRIRTQSARISVDKRYTRKVRRLLYMAEFLLLINYVEVITPLVFSIYLFITYHLPNREYYAVFDNVDGQQLVRTLNNVMMYCSLQLFSLLLLLFVLKRMLGLSPIQLVAFVLEKQIAWVQMDLTFWLFYNVQGSLQHLGYDYTFQFMWLSDASASE